MKIINEVLVKLAEVNLILEETKLHLDVDVSAAGLKSIGIEKRETIDELKLIQNRITILMRNLL